MNNLFNSILALCGFSVRMVSEQARRLRNSLLILIFAFYLMCFSQLSLGEAHPAFINILCLICFIATTFHYFRIGNIARETGLGEFLELTHITPNIPGAIQNQLGNALISFREKMFFFTAMTCMIVPYLPLWNNPWIIGAFTIIAVTFVVLIWRTGGTWLRYATWPTIIIYTIINFAILFPQPKFYFNELSAKSPVTIMPSSPAKIANEVAELRSKQREKILQKVYENALEWQQKNPGRDLPEDARLEIEATKEGISLEEYQAQLKAKAEEKVKSEKEKKTLIETVNTDGSQFPRNFQSFLLPGEHPITFEPVEAATGAKISILLPNGQVEKRLIENNSVSVEKEEKGCGVETTTPAVVRVFAL